MLVNQDFLLHLILKSGAVKNTVLAPSVSALGYIDLDEHFRIELCQHTNQHGIKLHKISLGDQQVFSISSTPEFNEAKQAITEQLNGNIPEHLLKEILDSLTAVLKQGLLDLQQEEYIEKLMIDCAS